MKFHNTAFLSALLIFSFCKNTVADSPNPPDPPILPGISVTFEPSGLDGSGFQSSIAADPFHEGVLLCGSDVGGFWRSTDDGASWTPTCLVTSTSKVKAFVDTDQMKVAQVKFSKYYENRVYAGVGRSGVGGFFVSEDGGKTWECRSDAFQFNGGNSLTGASGHPRSIGNMIEEVQVGGTTYLFAASQSATNPSKPNGIWRSTDFGYTWDRVDNTFTSSTMLIRGISLSDKNPNELFVATLSDGIYRIANALTANKATFDKIGGYTYDNCEEIKVIGGVLYAGTGAIGSNSHVLKSSNGGSTFSEIYTAGAKVQSSGADKGAVYSINGYVDDAGKTVLYVGFTTASDDAGGGKYKNIMRSDNGGEAGSWWCVSAAGTVSGTFAGSGSDKWWQFDTNGTATRMGGARMTVGWIEISPQNRNKIYTAGQGGLWRCDGVTDANPRWWPIFRHLNVTCTNAVLTDPRYSGYVYVSLADWMFVASTDGMQHVQGPYPVSGNNTSFSLAIGRDKVYYGSENGNGLGEVFSSTNPAAGTQSQWKNEGLASATAATNTVLGLCEVIDDQSQAVLLAAVATKGIWRKVGNDAFVKTNCGNAFAKSQPSNKGIFVWPGKGSNQRFVYFYDRQSGLYRSGDFGASWTLIYNKTTSGMQNGYIAMSNDYPNRLFLASSDGVFRLDNVESGTVQATNIQNFPGTPAAMTVANGILYVATKVTGGATTYPALWVTRDLWGGKANWINLAQNDDVYKAMGHFPNYLTVDPKGNIYVSMQNQGVLVGRVK